MGTAPTPKSLRLRSRCHDDLNVITWRLDDPDMGFFMESKLSESILFDTGMGMGIGKGGDFRVLPRVRQEGRREAQIVFTDPGSGDTATVQLFVRVEGAK